MGIAILPCLLKMLARAEEADVKHSLVSYPREHNVCVSPDSL